MPSCVAQGAHVTIHARSEDDLDEDVVKGKVAKASGANYSIHKEKAQVIPEAGPVVSVNGCDWSFFVTKI